MSKSTEMLLTVNKYTRASDLFNKYALLFLNKIKQQHLLTGNIQLQEREGSYKVKLFFVDRWDVDIAIIIGDNLDLYSFIVSFLDEHEDIYYSYQFHPNTEKKEEWECEDCFETSHHFHIYKRNKIKLPCNERLSIESLFSYIVARHHGQDEDILKKIKKIFGLKKEDNLLGLYAKSNMPNLSKY